MLFFESALGEMIGGLLATAFLAVLGFVWGRNKIAGRRLADHAESKERSGEMDDAYKLLNGTWQEYHFTASRETVFLSNSTVDLKVNEDRSVVGTSEYNVPQQLRLKMRISGDVRGGRCYLVCVCAQNPRDIATIIIDQILGETLIGIHSGIDWDQRLYASPVLLTKQPLSEDEVLEKLKTAKIYFYGES